MSAYFIAQIRITDPDTYQRYLDGHDEIFARYAGEVLAVDERPTVLEGSWPYTRTVVIRFPSVAEARRWYDSPEYRELARFRQEASTANVILVEGRD